MQITDRTATAAGLLGPDGEILTPDQLAAHIRDGWRCVRFECCFSFLLATVRRQSGVYLTENWQERYLRGLGYSAAALLLGPWGIPWGPVWTARSVWTNLTGGVDVTEQIIAQLGCEVPDEPDPSHR